MVQLHYSPDSRLHLTNESRVASQIIINGTLMAYSYDPFQLFSHFDEQYNHKKRLILCHIHLNEALFRISKSNRKARVIGLHQVEQFMTFISPGNRLV